MYNQVRAALVGLRARWIAEDPAHTELIEHVKAPIAKLNALATAQNRPDEYITVALSINRMSLKV